MRITGNLLKDNKVKYFTDETTGNVNWTKDNTLLAKRVKESSVYGHYVAEELYKNFTR
jgi:hypothetical protein